MCNRGLAKHIVHCSCLAYSDNAHCVFQGTVYTMKKTCLAQVALQFAESYALSGHNVKISWFIFHP